MADAAAELDEGGIQRTLKDLFAGAAGGVAQVLLGQLSVVVFIGYFCCSALDDRCFFVPSFAAIPGYITPNCRFSCFNTLCGGQEKVVVKLTP